MVELTISYIISIMLLNIFNKICNIPTTFNYVLLTTIIWSTFSICNAIKNIKGVSKKDTWVNEINRALENRRKIKEVFKHDRDTR